MQQESPPRVAPVRTITKLVLAAVCGMLGVVLLVAGKSTAGIAMSCSALIVLVLLSRRMTSSRRFVWPAVALVAVLWMVAVEGIAGTDIVPDQNVTGYKFADQVLAILQRFRENVFGSEESHGPGSPHPSPNQSLRAVQSSDLIAFASWDATVINRERSWIS